MSRRRRRRTGCATVPATGTVVSRADGGFVVRAEPLDQQLLASGLPPALRDLLDRAELDAVRDRAAALVAGATFPHDPSGRRYPWPLV